MEVTNQRQIKINVAPSEHDIVRVAAAIQRTTMAVFCRRLALAEAARLTRGLALPGREEHPSEQEDKP